MFRRTNRTLSFLHYAPSGRWFVLQVPETKPVLGEGGEEGYIHNEHDAQENPVTASCISTGANISDFGEHPVGTDHDWYQLPPLSPHFLIFTVAPALSGTSLFEPLKMTVVRIISCMESSVDQRSRRRKQMVDALP